MANIIDNIKDGLNNAKNAATEAYNNAKNVAEEMQAAVYPKVNLTNSLWNNPKVLAEKILKNQCTTASITVPVRDYSTNGIQGKTVTIPFYMTNDFSMGLTNKWEGITNFAGEELTNFINNTHATLGKGEAQLTVQSEAMNSKIWKGSEFDGFNVECLFLCTNRKVNTIDILRILSATCLPTKGSQQTGVTGGAIEGLRAGAKSILNDLSTTLGNSNLGKDGNALGTFIDSAAHGAAPFLGHLAQFTDDLGMVAPLNYGLITTEDGSTFTPTNNSTVTLQIGNYFRADKLLVQGLSNITLSKEVIAPPTKNITSGGIRTTDLYDPSPSGDGYGFPLYLKCSIKLIPYTLMHYTKFSEYFLDTNGNKIANALKAGVEAVASLVLPT